MPDELPRLFFPRLQRAGGYPMKKDGSHYGYSYYREYIRRDCEQRCVYCDSNENEVGGPEAMQLDHFRPEVLFEALINDPLNLHYGCARCNLLKSKHWPAGQAQHCHDGEKGFVDPFAEDRAEYFAVGDDGAILALRHPAKYVIGLLHLQREHLRKLRLRRQLLAEFEVQIDRVKTEAEAELHAGRQIDPQRVIELCELLSRIKIGFAIHELRE